MNLYAITGRIVRKPERLETDNGTKICRICVAVDKTNKETADDVDIFEVTLFRALAEEDYREGQFVAINGRMVFREVVAEPGNRELLDKSYD